MFFVQFYLRSDNDPRTMLSGQGLFSGMYPSSAAGLVNNTRVANWFIRDSNFEDITPNSGRCPQLNDAMSTAEYSDAMNTLQNQFTDLLNEVNTGMSSLSALPLCGCAALLLIGSPVLAFMSTIVSSLCWLPL
jgi:hypothetical protein